MRSYLLMILLSLSASPALAQQYPQQPSYPQQEANVTTYPTAPTSYPQTYVPPQPMPQQLPQNIYYPSPADAGQSVVTDVRQMNF